MKFGPSDIGALDARWGDARGARVHHVERSHVCAFTALWGEFTVCIYCTVVCVVRLHSTLALDDARRGDARGACVRYPPQVCPPLSPNNCLCCCRLSLPLSPSTHNSNRTALPISRATSNFGEK